MSDMQRREFIALLGGAAAAWPLAVRARQSSDGGPLIGILSPLSASTATRNIEGFRAGLRELGYFEGRNVTLALRFAEGMPERMPALATELVGLKPDVIVAAPETSLLAVRNVTRTIPIITIWLQDPVASGAVESIARPSGHVTGTWIAGDDALVGKRLELIKEAVPTIARIGVLVSPTEVQDSVIMRPLSAPAHALGLTVTITLLQLFSANRGALIGQAMRVRLPLTCEQSSFVAVGCLVSYGPNFGEMHRRAAFYVDRILKGERPADLPVEQPTKFDLAVNLKAAKALGLEVPLGLSAAADEIIE